MRKIFCFSIFLFILCCFNSCFIIPVDIKNSRLRLALAITTGALVTVANDAIEMIPLVVDKTTKDLSK